MDIVVSQIIPFRRLHYFVTYFRRLHQILIERNPATIRRISRLYTSPLIAILHHLYVCLQDSRSPEWQFSHYALFHLVSLPRELYLFLISQLTLILILIQAAYFSPQTAATFLIYRTAILRQSGWFLSPRHRGQPIWQYARRLLLLVANLLQPLCLIADWFVISSQAHALNFWLSVYQERPQVSFIVWIIKLLATELSLLLFYSALFTFVHVCIHHATMGIVLTQLFTIKMGQIGRILARPRRLFARLALHRYGAFLRHNADFLATVCRGNDMFGGLFLAYLLASCPLNCTLTVLVLTRQLHLNVQLPMLVIIFQQWICIFVIHLQAVRLNRVIHTPSRRLLGLMATDGLLALVERTGGAGGGVPLKALKLQGYLTCFHVAPARRFGFMYGKVALITMMSFAEFVLLYVQIMFYSYKWFQGGILL